MVAELFRRLRVDTRPFQHGDFRNLWLGQAVSTIGAEIGVVAVPYQVYTLTHSTAMVGLLGLASLIPLLVVPLIGGALPRQLAARPSSGLGSLRAARASGGDLQPRAAGAELARTPPRPRRRDRSGLGTLERLQLARGGRRARGRRCPDRGGGRALDVRDRPRHLYRVARSHLAAPEAAAARGGRPAEPRLDPRRLSLSQRTAAVAGDLRGRHERDGFRHADGSLPGARPAPPGQ